VQHEGNLVAGLIEPDFIDKGSHEKDPSAVRPLKFILLQRVWQAPEVETVTFVPHHYLQLFEREDSLHVDQLAFVFAIPVDDGVGQRLVEGHWKV
jgi:hypothetical protein